MSEPTIDSSEPTVILGAGPAGLSVAHRILSEAKKTGRTPKVVVLDRAPYVGGAGASFKWKGHTLDYGPHAFHTRGDEPEKLVRDLFTGQPEALIEGRKQVHVYLKGKRFKYPLQISEVAFKFNPFLSARILIEFALSSIFHAFVSIPVESFENWGRKRFGATLYKLSFGDYTEKVWKTKASKISEKFASEKIQGFSFVNLIVKLLRIGGQITEPYYQTWIYHRHGSGMIYERMAEEVREMGGEIRLGTELLALELREHSIQGVSLKDAKGTHSLQCSSIVNTLPLTKVIQLLGDQVPFTVRNSAEKLRYISLVLVYLEFDAERISEDHWFYLLDSRFKFNRVTEQKNLSPFTMEKGKTVLSFELTCRQGDELWNLSDQALFELAKKDCEGIHFLKDKKITDFLVKRVPTVYEIYYKDFDRHAQLVLEYLLEWKNLTSVGRRGLFLQGDMHQAVEMGLAVGDSISREGGVTAQGAQDVYRKYVKYMDV